MAAFLNLLLTASFHGSVVILAVLLLRLVLKKSPKKYICLLWLLAGIRLLLPIPVRSDLSLQPSVTLPTAELTGLPWAAVIPWLWAAVALGFGIYSFRSYRKLKMRVREAVRIRGGWESDRIDTAFILGFIKPRIYIPMGISGRARQHILAHEQTHLDKGDHWIKMIGFLALALHWFNPLVWVAYWLLCRDIEMACDERIVQFMEPEERKSYSAALLACSAKEPHFASPVAFGEVSVKQRILAVLNYKKHGFWMGLCGVLAIAFVTLCLMTTPGASAPAEEPLTPEQQKALEIVEQTRQDLEALFEKKEFFYEIVGSAGVEHGKVLWYVDLFKLGEDTIWQYTPSTSPDITEGRMERGGVHYAWQKGSWVQTDAEDTRFGQWLDLLRWDPSATEFVGEEAFEDGVERTFNVFWEGEDKTVHTTTILCGYGTDGTLQNVEIYRPDYEGTDRIHLILKPITMVMGEEPSVSERFAQAEALIREGTVSSEELASQAEYEAWGVFFRVDDDRLSARGSDVAYAQNENGTGKIYTTDAYWLEKWVDGAWETVPTIKEPGFSNDSQGVGAYSTFGYLDWSELYGALEPGKYRMGKTFRCRDDAAGYSQSHDFYSEFEIAATVSAEAPEAAAAALERCYSAYEALCKRDVIHFKTSATWEEEFWGSGKDYLKIATWTVDEQIPENNGRVDIAARWNGMGFNQVREDPDRRNSQVIGMRLSTMNAGGVLWDHSFSTALATSVFQRNNRTASFPEGVGIISDEMVRFLITFEAMQGEVWEEYYTYRFDENGDLTYMENIVYMGDAKIEYWVEVYDTPEEEIRATIQSYAEDLVVGSFSWADAHAKYTDEEFNIRETDFVNNGGSPIAAPADAARLALKEYPNLGDYLDLDISRDESAGMWKVTIRSYIDYQATYAFRDVYLTDDGATKLLVYEGPVWYDQPRK